MCDSLQILNQQIEISLDLDTQIQESQKTLSECRMGGSNVNNIITVSIL